MHLETTNLTILALVLIALMLSGFGSSKKPPHVQYPPTEPLSPQLRGYELYSWRVGREWYYTLTAGAHAQKTYDELALAENEIKEGRVKLTVQGVHDLEATLEQLPPGAHVAWRGPRELGRAGVRSGDMALPSHRVVDDVQAHCQELGIHLHVSP
jgi:hypothetical protein